MNNNDVKDYEKTIMGLEVAKAVNIYLNDELGRDQEWTKKVEEGITKKAKEQNWEPEVLASEIQKFHDGRVVGNLTDEQSEKINQELEDIKNDNDQKDNKALIMDLVKAKDGYRSIHEVSPSNMSETLSAILSYCTDYDTLLKDDSFVSEVVKGTDINNNTLHMGANKDMVNAFDSNKTIGGIMDYFGKYGLHISMLEAPNGGGSVFRGSGEEWDVSKIQKDTEAVNKEDYTRVAGNIHKAVRKRTESGNDAGQDASNNDPSGTKDAEHDESRDPASKEFNQKEHGDKNTGDNKYNSFQQQVAPSTKPIDEKRQTIIDPTYALYNKIGKKLKSYKSDAVASRMLSSTEAEVGERLSTINDKSTSDFIQDADSIVGQVASSLTNMNGRKAKDGTGSSLKQIKSHMDNLYKSIDKKLEDDKKKIGKGEDGMSQEEKDKLEAIKKMVETIVKSIRVIMAKFGISMSASSNSRSAPTR